MIQTTRAPRFERIDLGLNTQITDRDRDILRFVAIHRFVRSTHIAEFVDGSHQNLLRRLQRLFHLGYLNRPRCQIDYYYQGGSRELVYSLTSKGTREISNFLGNPQGLSVGSDVERLYLEHALMTTDTALAFERACRLPAHDHFQLHIPGCVFENCPLCHGELIDCTCYLCNLAPGFDCKNHKRNSQRTLLLLGDGLMQRGSLPRRNRPGSSVHEWRNQRRRWKESGA